MRWQNLASKAMYLSFDDNEALDPNKVKNYDESKELFKLSIKNADKAWPFLKYAELLDDYKSKIDLYERSFEIEKKEYTCVKLIEFNIYLDNLVGAKKWLQELKSLNSENNFIKKFSFIDEIDIINNKLYFNSFKEFDCVFYREAFPELELKSNLHAIFHFSENGLNEKRNYKRPISIPILEKSIKSKIILFTQFYDCDKETKSNIITCLKNNTKNKLIDEIVLFYDQESLEAELTTLCDESNKIKLKRIKERLNYKYWFEYSYENYPKDIKILANSDVYFDSNLKLLYKLDYRRDILYSCSRVDFLDGKLVKSKNDYGESSSFINNFISQDCWIFKNKINDFESNFILGYENCDVLLKYNCISSGCEFLNLFDHIKCIHIDKRTKKKRKMYNLISSKIEKNDHWRKLAVLASKESDKNKSVSLYKQSIELDPDESWPYIKLADMLSDKNDKIKLLKKAMTIDENPWSRILLIDILMIDNKEETKKIFDSLNQILKDKKIEQSIEKKFKEIKENLKKIEKFDPDFYIAEYPHVNSYHFGSGMSDEERFYKHYLNHGKKQGLFKNETEKNNNLKYESINSLEVSECELICPFNNLEAIYLLTTAQEIENKKFDQFVSQIIKKTNTCEITKKIDFNIVINKEILIPDYKLQKIFKNINIINLNLNDEEDIYIKEKIDKKLKYGLKSGPNVAFFKTIKIAEKYNTILLLETDCLLGDEWLVRLNSYVESANGFLISGGNYDGLSFGKSGSTLLSHINGGTGLYATGNHLLQKLIKEADIFLQKQAEKTPDIAYDYAIKQLIDHGIDRSYESLKDRLVWRFINRNYLPCKLIINCSTPEDSEMSAEELYNKFRYAILHKKH